jgi:hypothetical protein
VRFASRGSEEFYADAGEGFLGLIEASINRSTVKAGEPFVISIEERAGTGLNAERLLDFYLIVALPDGTFFSLLEGGGIGPPDQLLPTLAGRTPIDRTYPLLSIVWPAGLPAGSYRFASALVSAGADVLDQAEWLRVVVGSVEAD